MLQKAVQLARDPRLQDMAKSLARTGKADLRVIRVDVSSTHDVVGSRTEPTEANSVGFGVWARGRSNPNAKRQF